MISEHRFVSGYTSIWNDVLPLADNYWRTENHLVDRIYRPLTSKVEPGIRGLVNELAFITFEAALKEASFDRASALKIASKSVPVAIEYINRVSRGPALNTNDVNDTMIRESAILALRLMNYFASYAHVLVRPTFAGCGIVAACEGDLIVDGCLYEVKAGDRQFRVSDVRQLLVYASLAFAEGKYDFERIGLLNPRTGVSWERTLDSICRDMSGLLSSDILSKLIENFTPSGISR